MKNEVMEVFHAYTEALSKGDFGAVLKRCRTILYGIWEERVHFPV